MRADRRFLRGQALAECLVLAATLVVVLAAVRLVTQLQEARATAQAASRLLAFDCVALARRCATGSLPRAAADQAWQAEAGPVRSLPDTPAPRPRLPAADGGALLAEPPRMQVGTRRFDAMQASLDAYGLRSLGGAWSVLDAAAGPRAFGLASEGGLHAVRLDVRARLPGWDDAVGRSTLAFRADTVVLGGDWAASGPRGDARSVAARVEAGRRLPGVDEAVGLGLAPARALAIGAAALGLEASRPALRPAAPDPDLVPVDRLGGAR